MTLGKMIDGRRRVAQNIPKLQHICTVRLYVYPD
jgi:hypothetical protein